MKLQKYLAAAGIGSRRYCEQLIGAGRVTVNGVVAHIGQQVTPGNDMVAVDGVAVKSLPSRIVIALNKPRGALSACRRSREQGRLVTELVNLNARLFPIGRLDRDSEGLLLLTNDGELAHRLAHPRYGKEKEYMVTLDRPFPLAAIRRLIEGIKSEDGQLRALRITPVPPDATGYSSVLSVVLTEGHKRQLRRMFGMLGYRVTSLRRVRIADLEIGNLKPGEWRQLTEEELARLIPR